MEPMNQDNSSGVATPQSTHPAIVGASVTGVIAFLWTVWQLASPMLPQSTQAVLAPIVTMVHDNASQIETAVAEIESIKQQIAPLINQPTPNKASPTPIVPQDQTVIDLQNQVKSLTDIIQRMNQPLSPVPVNPVPVNPAPVNPVNPAPQTNTSLKAIDATGKVLSGLADAGTLFFIQASQPGGVWTVLESADKDVDSKIFPEEVSCVLRNGSSVTAVYSVGQPITTASLIVKSNQGAQPPPTPTPDDSGKRTTPVSLVPMQVSIVYDVPTATPEIMAIINNQAWWDEATAKGVKWGFFTVNTASPQGKAALAQATAKGVKAPFVVAASVDGSKQYGVIPLPKSIDDLPAALKSLAG